MIQRHTNPYPRARPKDGYINRCHSSMSYEKEKVRSHTQSFYTDDTSSFSQELTRIVQKYCPNVELKFSSDTLDGVLQGLDDTFEDILRDMKHQLKKEFIQKEDYLQKATSNLIKYEELLDLKKKEFEEQAISWSQQREEEYNNIENEKEEILILKARLEKEILSQQERLNEKEKKTSKILNDFEAMHSEIMKEKIESQNTRWDIEQKVLKLEEKQAIVNWKEKTIEEDMKKIVEEKSMIENERIANSILNYELLNAGPRIFRTKRSSSINEKNNFSVDPPSFAMNDTRFATEGILKDDSGYFKRKNSSFCSFSKPSINDSDIATKHDTYADYGNGKLIKETESHDRNHFMRKIRDRELRSQAMRERDKEIRRREESYERREQERREYERKKNEKAELERREHEKFDQEKYEQGQKEYDKKEYEKREQERLEIERNEQETIENIKREQERLERERIENEFKEEITKKFMVKERQLEEKQIEMELLQKMLNEEKDKIDQVRESLDKENEDLQAEKIAFYEEMMQERKKIEEYFSDIASKTNILNSRREKLLKARKILEDKEIMKKLEKDITKSPQKKSTSN
ncbi:hypothetical protein SteCoe_6019 [Stentor coeruleus]|uniref:Uncharacterized protein n=1 Tax=Stentor coeruleus TaxID=5963 RepID=A0A1R2CR11_9CILI|nr:hypothetical protein SteCoe_6019 [Stentor coeruleus]